MGSYEPWYVAPMLDQPVRQSTLAARERMLTIRTTVEALQTIDQIAAERGHTRSDMVRLLLQAGMEQYADGAS